MVEAVTAFAGAVVPGVGGHPFAGVADGVAGGVLSEGDGDLDGLVGVPMQPESARASAAPVTSMRKLRRMVPR
jgi:hypothetical protein